MIKKEKLVHLKNKEDGYEIDWLKAQKYFNSLCADGKHFNPSKLPLTDISLHWFNLFSKRNTGKTTALLGLSLILWTMYGLTTEYIRQYSTDITQSKYTKLLDGLISSGLLSICTNNEYCGYIVERNTKDVYLINADGEKAPQRWLTLISVDKAMNFKSSYNAPKSAMLIFDEYASDSYKNGDLSEWVLLHTWIATIRRSRIDYKIFMLANTVNPYNQYLQELGVCDDIISMREGDARLSVTDLGTKVYNVWLVGTTDDAFNEKERRVALEFHGFKNKSLRSIYGEDWDIRNYLKLPSGNKKRVPIYNIYLNIMSNFLHCEFYIINGLLWSNLVLTPFPNIKDDALVYTDIPTNSTLWLRSDAPKILQECVKHGRVAFNSNMAGLVWDSFIKNK